MYEMTVNMMKGKYSTAPQEQRDRYEGAMSFSLKRAEINRERAARLRKVARGEWHGLGTGLEDKAAVAAAVVGLIGGVFFLSSNITGNVIGNLNQTATNGLGVVLFIIGLVGAFAYFKRK